MAANWLTIPSNKPCSPVPSRTERPAARNRDSHTNLACLPTYSLNTPPLPICLIYRRMSMLNCFNSHRTQRSSTFTCPPHSRLPSGCLLICVQHRLLSSFTFTAPQPIPPFAAYTTQNFLKSSYTRRFQGSSRHASPAHALARTEPKSSEQRLLHNFPPS